MSLAELMFQSASRAIETSKPDLAGAYQRGAQLAQAHENHKLQKEKLQQQQKQVTQAGMGNVFKFLETADKFQDKTVGNKLRNKGLDAVIEANGVAEQFPPHLREALKDSEEARLGVMVLKDKVRKGEMSFEEAAQQSQNLDALVDLSNIAKASEAFIASGEKDKRTEVMATGQAQRQERGIEAKESVADVEFARAAERQNRNAVGKAFAKFKADGGKAAADKKLEKLRTLLADMKSGKIVTGTNALKVFGGSNTALDIAFPDIAAARDKARAGLSLREQLGGAFTKIEGDEIKNQTFNPRLPTEVNMDAVAAEIKLGEDKTGGLLDEARKVGLMGGEFQPQQQREVTPENESSFISDGQVDQLRGVYKQLTDAGKSPEEIFTMLQSAPSLKGASDQQLNAIIKKIQIEGK